MTAPAAYSCRCPCGAAALVAVAGASGEAAAAPPGRQPLAPDALARRLGWRYVGARRLGFVCECGRVHLRRPLHQTLELAVDAVALYSFSTQ